MNKRIYSGRSMIEMLGVLGIMAVITVLAITAYQMAYRNSRMNEFKQDVAAIVQQVDKSYVGHGFMDEGVVLGEDRDFESMFVDTKYLKSSVSPFGGVYNVSAVSNDLFELEVGPLEKKDCEYLVSDAGVLKESESVALACEDEDGAMYYSVNNPKHSSYSGGNNNGGSSGGGLASKSLKQLSNKCKNGKKKACNMLIEKDTDSKKLGSVCRETGNEDVCTAFLTNENSTRADMDEFCSYSSRKCSQIISESDDVPVKAVLSTCVAGGDRMACDLLLKRDDVSKKQIKNACKDSANHNLCTNVLSDPDVKIGTVKEVCGEVIERCNYIASNEDVPTKVIVHTCAIGGDRRACSSLVEKEGVTIKQKMTACSGSGNYEVCSNLLDNGKKLTGEQVGEVCNADIRNCYSALKNESVSKGTAKKACNQTGDGSICYVACVKGSSSSCDKASKQIER